MNPTDPIPQPDPTQPTRFDNRYVPLRLSDLAVALSEELGRTTNELPQVAEAIQEIVDQEARAFERELVAAYAPFDPDCDLLLPDSLDDSEEACRSVERSIAYLLDKANFERMSSVGIARTVAAARSHGLRVRLNPDQIRSLQLWVRGRGTIERCHRSWRRGWRAETLQVEVFRRIAVIARLRDDPHLYVKLFKDIPQTEIEALLPHAEVTMTWVDRLMVVGGGAGAIGTTGWKLFNLAVLAISRLAWILVFGLATLAVRIFTGYQRAKTRRVSQRTQHLYYQNLGNNQAALHKLISLITHEEAKEALLAYVVCLRDGGFPDQRALRDAAGEFLLRRFGVEVDFDAADAEETLDRFELWEDRDQRRVAPPELALARLAAHWGAARTITYHATVLHAKITVSQSAYFAPDEHAEHAP